VLHPGAANVRDLFLNILDLRELTSLLLLEVEFGFVVIELTDKSIVLLLIKYNDSLKAVPFILKYIGIVVN
jgi:hypothetical protein